MIRILGHRGGRDLWPENSLQGFRNAIELGVDVVEFDVHLSADDEIVVIHDPTLERTTQGEGLVAHRTVAELGRTRLRGSEEGVPTFEATLNVFENVATGLFVEIKTDTLGRAYRGLVKRVLASVAKRNMTARTTIVSFIPETLEAARTIEPSIGLLAPVFRATSQMLGGVPAMLERLERIPGCLISVQRDMLWTSRDYFRERIPADRFCVGVTNDATELDYWMTQPVFQVGSDRPDLALAARQRHGR